MRPAALPTEIDRDRQANADTDMVANDPASFVPPGKRREGFLTPPPSRRKAATMMQDYQVTFFRHSIDKSGYPSRSNLGTVHVLHCADRRQAFRKAVSQFEYDRSLYEWRTLADECEVVEEREPKALRA